MSLEYYQNDYLPADQNYATYGGSTSWVGSYTGNITAWRWKSRYGNSNTVGHFGYEYSYNHRNELETAQMGNMTTVNTGGGLYYFKPLLGNDYKVSNLTYDKNGNIQTLNRTINPDSYTTFAPGCFWNKNSVKRKK